MMKAVNTKLENESRKEINKEFTPRAVIWGLVIGLLMLCMTLYLMVMVGVTVAISPLSALLGLAVLPIIGGMATKKEINIVQTIASSVAASGMAASTSFAGAMLFGYKFNWMIFITILLISTTLGICFITLLRKHMTEDPSLKFPASIVCKTVIDKAENRPKLEIRMILIFMVGTIIFSIFQNIIPVIPTMVDFSKYLPTGMLLNIAIMPMLVAMGYIIGSKLGIMLMISSLFANIVVAPIGTNLGWYPNPQANFPVMQNFNLSIVLGLAISGSVIPLFKQRKSLLKTFNLRNVNLKEEGKNIPVKLMIIVGSVCILVAILFYKIALNVNPMVIILTACSMILLAVMTVRVAAESGLGVGAIADMTLVLIIGTIIGKPIITLLIVGMGTSITALANDTMNDLKTGQMINASPKKQVLGQFIGLVPGVLVGIALVYAIITAKGLGTPEAPFPIAKMYYGMTAAATGQGPAGIISMMRMGIGALGGIILSFFGISGTAIAVTFYLPSGYIIAIGIGGILRKLVERFKGRELGEKYVNAATGVFLGDGLVTVLSLLVSLFV